ncbi:HupE/UreJ family protein [Sphingomonas sp. AR_OL41]|uniref:HupE/UreJ family protein n=1 Tax=Sphingomonas sp. AR_OL41 TaxID=3042729 RepID=UPI0024806994|nr:HupE/UreJ family protein [Sphingomonas sp. AR_OL41]MDH7976098.1 HupE/UreJ family protein [Sphingomonas sp. AR_OL41]
MVRRWWWLVLAASWLCLPGLAAAHLLPRANATLHLKGDKGYLVVSVPVSALRGVDDDRNGLLDGGELARHHAAITRQFGERFHLASPDGATKWGFIWAAHPGSDNGETGPAPYVVLLAGAQFARPPASVTIRTDLFGSGDDAQMTLRVRRDEDVEVGVFTAATPEHSFLRGRWAIFRDYVATGVEHILLGYDHLLFLLTVIVGAAGWRYWLGVVTSFTVAHSITLTLAALGLVRLAPALVEPAIAASIVAVATLNLLRPQTDARARIAIVFACGLLHGLGFAAALGDMGLVAGNRLATLAGFNIGVELGQFAFLAGVLALGGLLARVLGPYARRLLPRIASALAAAGGAVLLVARILPVLPTV